MDVEGMEITAKDKSAADTWEMVGGMGLTGNIPFHLTLSCEPW